MAGGADALSLHLLDPMRDPRVPDSSSCSALSSLLRLMCLQLRLSSTHDSSISSHLILSASRPSGRWGSGQPDPAERGSKTARQGGRKPHEPDGFEREGSGELEESCLRRACP